MINQLKKWLNKPENSTAKLAYLLGYKSGSTISNWIARDSIPGHKTKELTRILSKQKKREKNGINRSKNNKGKN